MKLYYTPGACSLAPHILVREVGLAAELVQVDLRAKKLPDGSDYLAVNEKGAVPALGLDAGEVLTENAAILLYLADLSGNESLLPTSGIRRYRVLEWVIYITTELHKGYAPLWNPASADDLKEATRALLAKKFAFVERRLGEGDYLTGSDFTIADAYLYVMLRWAETHRVDIGPGLATYRDRVAARPGVAQALEEEGLS
jgi:glutathione S-transferase